MKNIKNTWAVLEVEKGEFSPSKSKDLSPCISLNKTDWRSASKNIIGTIK